MAQIHIINLQDADKRRRFMLQQMSKLGLSYMLFDAIKGSSLSAEELEKKVDMNEVAKYPKLLTRNILGASLSHMGVYKRIVESEEDWHLILEDDVVLAKDAELLINHIKDNQSLYKRHLVLFYSISLEKNVELLNSCVTSVNEFGIHKVLSKDIGGAGAYMIHRDTAKLLLEYNEMIKVAPDDWNFFLSQGAISQINCVYPFAARPGFFESTIGYVDPQSTRFKIKRVVEKYKIPLLYQMLRWNRRRVWKKTSKVVFN